MLYANLGGLAGNLANTVSKRKNIEHSHIAGGIEYSLLTHNALCKRQCKKCGIGKSHSIMINSLFTEAALFESDSTYGNAEQMSEKR